MFFLNVKDQIILFNPKYFTEIKCGEKTGYLHKIGYHHKI